MTLSIITWIVDLPGERWTTNEEAEPAVVPGSGSVPVGTKSVQNVALVCGRYDQLAIHWLFGISLRVDQCWFAHPSEGEASVASRWLQRVQSLDSMTPRQVFAFCYPSWRGRFRRRRASPTLPLFDLAIAIPAFVRVVWRPGRPFPPRHAGRAIWAICSTSGSKPEFPQVLLGLGWVQGLSTGLTVQKTVPWPWA